MSLFCADNHVNKLIACHVAWFAAGMYLDTCGKINNVENIVVRKEGILKGAYPSQTSDADNYAGTWDIESISIDYGGTITSK